MGMDQTSMRNITAASTPRSVLSRITQNKALDEAKPTGPFAMDLSPAVREIVGGSEAKTMTS